MLEKFEGWKKILLGGGAAAASYGTANGWFYVSEDAIQSMWVALGGVAAADFQKGTVIGEKTIMADLLRALDGKKKLLFGGLAAGLAYADATGSLVVPEESIQSLWLLVAAIAAADVKKYAKPSSTDPLS